MGRSEEYQTHAINCIRLAQEFPDSTIMLLEMAQAWDKLAQHAQERENVMAGIQYPHIF